MLNKIFAYVTINVKSLLKDKIPFLWSVLLPLVMFYIDKDRLAKEGNLIYWWVYMILCSYIYGIGLYALEMKENGCLKTYFSINNSSVDFFIGNLLTQIVFCFVSIGIFDAVAIIVKRFNPLVVVV